MVRMGEGVMTISQRGPGGPDMTDQQREEMRQKRDALEQELKSVLPAEERQKLEQQEAERRQRMEEMANLPPDQRRGPMERMIGPPGGFDKMNRQRVVNSTPEQRAEMLRREREMRQSGGGGGFIRIGG